MPGILPMLADGRLHLTAVNMLEEYLTTGNAGELLAAATHRSKSEIALVLARRFPRQDVPARLQELSPAPARVETSEPAPAPARVDAPPRPRMAPLSPGRFELRVTIAHGTVDLMEHCQALQGRRLSPNDLPELLDRAFRVYSAHLEVRKFAATERPRRSPATPPAGRRTVPAHVRRAVWRRDGGQCTFVSATGHRCRERSALEFDHIDPVARGGRATVDRMRLRCRAHDQHEAEQAFGAAFMSRKREAARQARDARLTSARRTSPRGASARGTSARPTATPPGAGATRKGARAGPG